MNLKEECLKIKIAEAKKDIESGHCFSVSPVRAIAALKGIKINDDFEDIRMFHCVDWDAMGAEVKSELITAIDKFLNPPAPKQRIKSFFKRWQP